MFEGKTERTEEWYGTEFSLERIPEQTMQVQQHSERHFLDLLLKFSSVGKLGFAKLSGEAVAGQIDLFTAEDSPPHPL